MYVHLESAHFNELRLLPVSVCQTPTPKIVLQYHETKISRNCDSTALALTLTLLTGLEKRSIEGRVVQKADCMPQGGQKYMKLKMSQILSATKPSRTVQQLDRAVRSNYKPVARIREEVICF